MIGAAPFSLLAAVQFGHAALNSDVWAGIGSLWNACHATADLSEDQWPRLAGAQYVRAAISASDARALTEAMILLCFSGSASQSTAALSREAADAGRLLTEVSPLYENPQYETRKYESISGWCFALGGVLFILGCCCARP